MDVDTLIRAWRAYAAEWHAAGTDTPEAERLLHDVLDGGALPRRYVDAAGDNVPADDAAPPGVDAMACEIALLRASGLFLADEYLEHNPDVASAGIDPLVHFCRFGWKELRSPRPDFDVWWYWTTHLDPRREQINPLLHFVLAGHAAGLATHPGALAEHAPATLSQETVPRRICLFAGYDPDGIIDDCVIDYVRELSRHADVYYLSDGYMDGSELNKLAPYAKGAWAERHGAYDFGSWSALAREHVGWDAIERCDELLLVNDSGYLLRSLDGVFAKMDASACDWWGMQLSKRNFEGEDDDKHAVPVAEVRASMLPETEQTYLNSLHISSYFVAFRKPVLRDPGFRKRLDTVVTQEDKSHVILKYEIGLSRWLMARGYVFDTFVPALHPYHPTYTLTHFDLIREGFPLLKRLLLAGNPLNAPGLVNWKERILELVPDADVAMFERNLLRVADDDKLQRSFAITQDEHGEVLVPRLLDGSELIQADRDTPKFDHWWAFPVCAFDHTFAGNERAVFEEVKDDPSIKKIILTRSKRIEAGGENVVVLPLRSPDGQYHLLRSGQVFVKHGPRVNTGWPLLPERHNFINLWHGIPLKRFGYASLDMQDRLGWVKDENRRCRAVVCSSAMDRLAMLAAFHPLTYGDLWPTGLPRNDFIMRPAERMPTDFRQQEAALRQEVDNRRLVLFMPTFRNGQEESSYHFAPEELAWLTAWLQREHAVLGVREHMADTARSYQSQLTGLDVLDLSSRRYPNIEVLYRVGAALISDYSSCAIDFLLTGRPVVNFVYDLDRYASEERGLFYDLEQVLPGPVCRDFDQLSAALESVFTPPRAAAERRYERCRGLFFDHVDDRNAWRVTKRVRQFYVGESTVA